MILEYRARIWEIMHVLFIYTDAFTMSIKKKEDFLDFVTIKSFLFSCW